MTLTCIFCGNQEESDVAIEHPVCEREECMAAARRWGWKHWAESAVECQRSQDGEMMFRLRSQDGSQDGSL